MEKVKNNIPDFIKHQALNGKRVVKVVHKDGRVDYVTKPTTPVVNRTPKPTPKAPVDYKQKETHNVQTQYYKEKKKFSVKKLLPIVLIPVMIAGATQVYKYGATPVNEYNQQNQIYSIDKVKEDLQFYGGDLRYVEAKNSMFGFKKAELYSHLNISENRAIKIGYASTITASEKEQFQHVFDYVNSIFKVIDPDIKFEVVDQSQADCDIWIKKDVLGKNTGMSILTERDLLTGSKLTGAVINVNSTLEMSTPQQRFYMLHEFMHLLTGSSDVDYTSSPTFSVYNYNDIGFIVDQIENAWESEEEKKEATNGKFATVRPIMSEEEQNSWVSYLPTDVGTLIALYGDSSIPENKEAYINLLNQTLEECSEIFGERQPFFVDDYVVPKNPEPQTPTNNDDTNENDSQNTSNGSNPQNNENDGLSY